MKSVPQQTPEAEDSNCGPPFTRPPGHRRVSGRLVEMHPSHFDHRTAFQTNAYSENQWDSGSAQKNRELTVIDRLHVVLLFSSLAFVSSLFLSFYSFILQCRQVKLF